MSVTCSHCDRPFTAGDRSLTLVVRSKPPPGMGETTSSHLPLCGKVCADLCLADLLRWHARHASRLRSFEIDVTFRNARGETPGGLRRLVAPTGRPLRRLRRVTALDMDA